MGPSKIVADASVIINFLRIDRMDLLGAHADPFITTDHVAAEIADAYPDQQARYRAALDAGHLIEQRVDDPAEVELFLRLARGQRLGAGERSAIAVALKRSYRLAIDDSRAIRRALQEVGVTGNPIEIARTQDIVVELIRRSILSVEGADAIRVDWANHHRFRLQITSFDDLL
jgi:predicted nucleic acid-binding protein